MIEIGDFRYFFELTVDVVGAVVVSVSGVTVTVSEIAVRIMPDEMVWAGVAQVQSAIGTVTSGIMSDVTGRHAEDHVTEAHHCAHGV